MKTKDNYINISQAAKQKGVSRGSIYQAIALRRIDSEMIAGRVVVVDNEKFQKYKKTGRS